MVLHSDYLLVNSDAATEHVQRICHAALAVVNLFAHEVEHLLTPDRTVSPSDFKTRDAFANAYLDHVAEVEGRALYCELVIAEEVYKATGVILPTGVTNYRCGTLQAIYHSNVPAAEKLAQCAAHARTVHRWFIDGKYRNDAIERWNDRRSRKSDRHAGRRRSHHIAT